MNNIGKTTVQIGLVMLLALSGILVWEPPVARADGTGSISGNVTAGGSPLANVQVNAYDPTNGSFVAGVRTGGSGNYTLSLPAGSYQVQARPSEPPSLSYANEWYEGVYVRERAKVVAVTAGVDTPNINIGLDPLGFISGNVTAGGAAVTNVSVGAYDSMTGWSITSTRTSASGNYTLKVPAGSFVVRARPSQTLGLLYGDEWYDGVYARELARPVSVITGATTGSINIGLDAAGRISGSVTAGGVGIPNVSVSANDATTGFGIASASTNATGGYTLIVPAGSYQVQANPTGVAPYYAREYYGGVYTREQATSVPVNAGETKSNIDISVDPVGFISGKVAFGVTPLAAVSVSASDNISGLGVASTSTGWDGSYTLRLPPGSYVVQAQPAGIGLAYANEYYGGVYAREQARPVSVTLGNTTPNIDISVDPVGFISGKVSFGVTPLAGVSVGATDSTSGLSTGSTRTGWDGNYTLRLPPGSYVVQAQPAGIGLAYANEYYGEVYARERARPVSVTLGNTTPNIDISVDPVGFISGKVTFGVTPLAGVTVSATDSTSGLSTGSTRTGWDGNYTLRLPPGSYVVQAQPASLGLAYANEYYGGVYGREQATPVSVGTGATTPNIDISVDPVGFISGKVTFGVTPLAGVTLSASNSTSGLFIGSTRTGWDGSYTLRLPPGSYVVQAQPASLGLAYANEYYSGVYAREQARPVSVTLGATTPNIDISVDPVGFISGKVSFGVTPLAGVSVGASDPTSGLSIGSARTGWDGSYTLRLPPGSYVVQAQPASLGLPYVNEYWGGVYNREQATPVSVAIGATTPNIDIRVGEAGFLAGRVTVSGYNPAYISVNAQDANSYLGIASARTRWDGTYTINVPPGDYVLKARPDTSGLPYAAAYNGGVCAIQFASPISVAVGGTINGIDFTPAAAGFINGQVTAPGGALAYVNVVAVEPDYLWQLADTRTRWDGTYTMNLPPGDFNLQVRPDTNRLPYTDKWYNNVYYNYQATKLSVTAGSIQNGINFTLEPGGTVSGRVVATSSGQPVAGASVNAYLHSSLSIPGGQMEYGSSASVRTDSNGNYRFTVPAGLYGVRANLHGYATEWYVNSTNGTYVANQAQPVTVSTGEVSGINLSLEPGYTISGHMYNTGTTGIYGAKITTNYPEGSPTGPGGLVGATSSPDGSYRVDGLPAGTFMVRAWKPDYTLQYYNGKDFWAQADNVTVGPTSPTGIDFHLTAGAGSISGMVYEADGTTPIFVYEADGTTLVSQRAIQVYGLDGSDWILAYRAKTLVDGSYSVPSVKLGNYRVFTAPSGYVPQWYQQKPNESDADSIAIPTSSWAATGVNFIMSRQDETAVPYQTPVGENATVSDQYLGVTMNYATVSTGGTTSFLATTAAPPTDGFTVDNRYIDIVSQATYSGNITFTINYSDADIPTGQDEADLKLWHWNGSSWDDVTVSVDTVNNIITGRSASLSKYYAGIPWKVTWQPPLTAHKKDVYIAQEGSTIPIKFKLTDAGKTITNASVIVSITRDRDGQAVLPEQLARIVDNHYQVNANTADWEKTDYTVRLSVSKNGSYTTSYKLSLVQKGQAKGINR